MGGSSKTFTKIKKLLAEMKKPAYICNKKNKIKITRK